MARFLVYTSPARFSRLTICARRFPSSGRTPSWSTQTVGAHRPLPRLRASHGRCFSRTSRRCPHGEFLRSARDFGARIACSAARATRPRSARRNGRASGPATWAPPADAPHWLATIDRPIVLVTCSTERQDDRGILDAAVTGLPRRGLFVVATSAAYEPDQFRPEDIEHCRVERYLSHEPIVARATARDGSRRRLQLPEGTRLSPTVLKNCSKRYPPGQTNDLSDQHNSGMGVFQLLKPVGDRAARDKEELTAYSTNASTRGCRAW